MKVTVNQQVITRPEVFKAIKPGFQNFGKNVKINNLGQLVTRSDEAKELKKAFSLEDAFKDIGYQNISKKTEIELQNIGQNTKDFVSQNIGQKEEKESRFGFQNIIQNAEVKGNRLVTPSEQLVIQNAKGKRIVTAPGQTVSQEVSQKGRTINTLA